MYYVAVTLDGRIAGPDGESDFFPQGNESGCVVSLFGGETDGHQGRQLPFGRGGAKHQRVPGRPESVAAAVIAVQLR